MRRNPNRADQPTLFDAEADEARSLLNELLAGANLYQTSAEFMELAEFAARLRNFAPFNTMLLRIQKPGLRYAASAWDWEVRFNRQPKTGARPLLIMWPFGPVALVYDVEDTIGPDLPAGVNPFTATGVIDPSWIDECMLRLDRKRIHCTYVDHGIGSAGAIGVTSETGPKGELHYRLLLNAKHVSTVQFATLAHELGHLFLGHLAPDKHLGIIHHVRREHIEEIEAELVAHVVCRRHDVKPNSDQYLSQFVDEDMPTAGIGIDRVMLAAGRVEQLIGLPRPPMFATHR